MIMTGDRSESNPSPPHRSIRATYTDTTITVYQAYPATIANAAVAAQSLNVPLFKRGRATWIKPSFTWMAYRSGYASKPNQERVLALEISRAGFEWALRHACLAHVQPQKSSSLSSSLSREEEEQAWRVRMEQSCVRVQWDPERDVSLRQLPWRSLQVGLMGEAVGRYVDEWVVSIRDVTGDMVRIGELVRDGKGGEAQRLLPEERVYVLSDEVASIVEMTLPQATAEGEKS